MGALFDKIAEWLKEILVDAAMGNLTDLFQSVNDQVQSVAGQVGTSPANFSPSIFAMIRNISESVILPIAGVILTFIACYELIQLVTDHNNLAQLDTWIIPCPAGYLDHFQMDLQDLCGSPGRGKYVQYRDGSV